MDPRHANDSNYSKIIMILLEELTLIKHIYIKHFSISIIQSFCSPSQQLSKLLLGSNFVYKETEAQKTEVYYPRPNC